MYKASDIKNIIQRNEMPYFTLKAKKNAYASEYPIYTNAGSDKPNCELEKTLELFDAQLEMHQANPEQIFVIELSKTKSGSHGSGKSGPFEFVIDGQAVPQSNQHAGGTSLGAMQPMNEQVNSALGSLGQIYQQRDQFLRDQGKLDMERALFEQEKKQFAEEKKRELEELKVLREKYESNTERVKGGLEKAVLGLIDGTLNIKGTQTPSAPIAGLDEEPLSEIEEKMNDIFDEIGSKADRDNWSLQDVEAFGHMATAWQPVNLDMNLED